uniref:Uncharacterized protein n=1 Tax=Glossina palpalis gambiensis TaxID=67801 RepID=A0A1B0C7E1_9MUSC
MQSRLNCSFRGYASTSYHQQDVAVREVKSQVSRHLHNRKIKATSLRSKVYSQGLESIECYQIDNALFSRYKGHFRELESNSYCNETNSQALRGLVSDRVTSRHYYNYRDLATLSSSVSCMLCCGILAIFKTSLEVAFAKHDLPCCYRTNIIMRETRKSQSNEEIWVERVGEKEKKKKKRVM